MMNEEPTIEQVLTMLEMTFGTETTDMITKVIIDDLKKEMKKMNDRSHRERCPQY